MTLDKLHDPHGVQEMLQNYCDDSKYSDLYINLVSRNMKALFSMTLLVCNANQTNLQTNLVCCHVLFQEPYANQSAVSIQSKFSLHRTYIIFRSLGLRHLTVVDEHNHVVGIITRKDLMGFNMEEKLSNFMNSTISSKASVEMNETVNRAV